MNSAPLRTPVLRLALIALCVVAGSLAFVQSAAAIPPVITLSYSPAPPDRPNVNEVVSFSAQIDWGDVLTTGRTVAWTFGDGAVIPPAAPPLVGPATANHAYAVPGSPRMTLTATNNLGQITTTPELPVRVNAPPRAAFSVSPPEPIPGQDVLFASNSSDPDPGDGLTHAWNFGDNVTSNLLGPTHPFATIGSKTVRLTVQDPFGAIDSITRNVVVKAPVLPPAPPGAPVPANAPPSAAFAFSPRSPTAGQQVEFVSSALDPEGRLREQRWDLDGDGEFDDARGDEVLYTFASRGPKTVRLRVEDAAGGAAVRERTLTVDAGPVARAGFLSPFPVVRLTGEVRERGAKVRLLSVRAPRGSLVRVSCDGTGCPVKNKRRSVRKGPLRFKIFERMFRAGTKLEVFVRKPGAIGKYTSFAIRAGDSPKRTDRCLSPGVKRPRRCGAP